MYTLSYENMMFNECKKINIHKKKCFFLVLQMLRELSILSFCRHYGNVIVECSLDVLKQTFEHLTETFEEKKHSMNDV